MADLYGATTLPVTAPVAATDAISDPALNTVLRWAEAILEAKCETAWLSIAPGEPMVRYSAAHRPEREDFGGSNRLPALYCYADDETPQRFADAIFGRARAVVLLWVFPPGTRFANAQRAGILAGLTGALHSALESDPQYRDPAWVDTGDTDPSAATWGSHVGDRCGFEMARLSAARHAEIPIDTEGRGKVVYQAAYFEITATEYFRHGAPTTLGSGITADIRQNPADPAFVQTIQATASDFTPDFPTDFH